MEEDEEDIDEEFNKSETLRLPESYMVIAGDSLWKINSQASRNVSVYYAFDDLALRSSKISILRNKVASRRQGHTG